MGVALIHGGVFGWDLGGAHLKCVKLDNSGAIEFIRQAACPLWLGIDRLDLALDQILNGVGFNSGCIHAITMTGELVDTFASRAEGVVALTDHMCRRLGQDDLRIFAGEEGFKAAHQITIANACRVASANWLASGLWVASRLKQALLVDIGSTTTDLLPISDHQVAYRGYTDSERMGYDELLYTGVTRTPLMAVVKRAPLDGAWVGLMAEHFATTADVYRLTGDLPEYADQMPAADHGAKTVIASGLRLARQFGRDVDSLPQQSWKRLALHLRERQLASVRSAIELQISRGFLGDDVPLVGAGVGRFLVKILAERIARPFVDFSEFFVAGACGSGFTVADCGPAASVAALALQDMRVG